MPTSRERTFYTYDNERDGQISSGATVTSPWFDADGHSELLLMGAFAGGTTTVEVEQSADGVTVDLAKTGIASAGLTDGVKVNLGYPYVRFKIVQTVAVTTNAELSVKASD